MKNLKLITKITLLYVVIILSACSPKAPKIEYEIPSELKNNEKAVVLIEDVAESVQNINNGFAEMIALSFDIKEQSEESDGNQNNAEKTSSIWKMAKAGVSALKMAKEQEKMEKMMLQADSIKMELTAEQGIALDTVLARIERQVGKVDIDKLGISEEQLAELKENGGKMSFSTNQEESEEYSQLSDKEKEETRIIAKHENRADGEEGYLEEQQDSNVNEEVGEEMEGWDYVWVVLMVIVIIIVSILPTIIIVKYVIRFLRNLRNL